MNGAGRRAHRTRVGGVLAALVLLAALGCTPADDPDPSATPTPTPTPTPTSAETQEWARCTDPEDGYGIDYPADWATNSEAIDHVSPCSLFDPEREQLRTEGMELPADIAVSVYLESAPFDDVTTPGAHAQEVDRRETTVDGRAAVRIETESTGEGLFPQGWRYTTWAIDLDAVTLVARSFDVGEPAYDTKQEVLDAMVASLRLDDVPAGCSAEGLDADPEDQDLPDPVAELRAAIAAAAVDCDMEQLEDLAGAGFSYSFGQEDDLAGHLRRQEAAGAEPLRYLVELLDRPHAVVEDAERRHFVWPSAFAYDDWAAVPDEDREALRPLYGDDDFATFQEFGGYIGYRIGITEDGDWLFFLVGD